MKYVCIDNDAVAELVSGRQYQSIDFQEGERLIKGLRSDIQFATRIRNIFFFQDSESVFIVTSGQWKQKRFLVIDCETSSLFNTLPAEDSLTSFQKLLRFCIKYWTNGAYSKSEKIISGTTKAVVFPLPFAANAPFRIAIERQPLKDRLKKRDMDGRFLLVYKAGTEGGDSATETVEETNFRRAFDRLPSIYEKATALTNTFSQEPREGEMTTTDLTSDRKLTIPSGLPFVDWLPLLTAQQRKFIFSPPRPLTHSEAQQAQGRPFVLCSRQAGCCSSTSIRGSRSMLSS